MIRIGDHTIRAGSKIELQDEVSKAIDKAFTNPKISIIRVGDQVSVVVEHMGITATYAADACINGIAEHREISWSHADLRTATTGAALHMFKADPASYDKLFKDVVPEGRADEWRWYAKAVQELDTKHHIAKAYTPKEI